MDGRRVARLRVSANPPGANPPVPAGQLQGGQARIDSRTPQEGG
jgi:hypothetical protein